MIKGFKIIQKLRDAGLYFLRLHYTIVWQEFYLALVKSTSDTLICMGTIDVNNDFGTLKVIPFGAQYYRAPTPEPSEWKSDMAAMRKAGFNTIKIWAQWRWNMPAEDKFYFDDLDQLMDLADEADLKVVINTIMDCAPAWLYRKYPDSIMIDSNGNPVGPAVLSWRQIGGAPGPCFHHPEAMKHFEDFFAAHAKRYSDHPALLLWDLWNEPELTVGMKREAKVDNLVCYCENSRQEFIQWLQAKYGSVDGVNAAWHRNYQNWDELELPVRPDTFVDMVDWRMFFIDTVTQNMELRAKIVRENDPNHAVMCHTVPTPHFNPITCGSDDWELAKCCDLFGNSVGSDPMPADMMRAAARGKTVINAEIHAIPGGTFYRPKPIGLEEMKHHLLVPLAHGIKGFLFWQYRAETLGGESPAWGMTHLDGSPAPWMEPVSRICDGIVSNSDFFLNAEREKPNVALFMSSSNQIFCWAASSNTHFYNQSLSGAYRALYRANYSIDFIHPNDVFDNILDQHKVLYMPLPYWTECEVLEKIKDWVRAGGHLISECFLGGIDVSTGYHSKVMPGCGFDEVFGVREGVCYPESGVFNSYAWQADGAGDGIKFNLERSVGGLKAGVAVPGFHVGATFCGSDAEVIARYPTGEAAVTTHKYGEGSATIIGTMMGAAFAEKGNPVCADFIANLAGQYIDAPRPKATPSRSVRVDILSDGNKRWIMLQNLTEQETEAVIELPFKLTKSPVEMFTGEEAGIDGGKMQVTLQPSQIKAFWD